MPKFVYVCRKAHMTVHNLPFSAHTLYARVTCTKTFLLVKSLVWSKQLLCFVHGQVKKSEQKHITKFVGFITIPLSTMTVKRYRKDVGKITFVKTYCNVAN